jgi:hypothetical protein
VAQSADKGPGDSRAIENPTEPSDMPDELEAAVRSDAGQRPVKGEEAGDAGSGDERVSEPGEGLVTEEGVNERNA